MCVGNLPRGPADWPRATAPAARRADQPSDCVCCKICGRSFRRKSFRRESDKKQHKCVEERSKPEWEQYGGQTVKDGSEVEEDLQSIGARALVLCDTGYQNTFSSFFVIPLVEVA